MKRIVIPTDLTLYSIHLIRHALHLMQGEICHITLLQITPISDSITELLTLPRSTAPVPETSAEFTQALARLQRHYVLEIEAIELAHIYCDSIVQFTRFVQESNIDLVLSSVALPHASEERSYVNRLLTKASFPVLYMPEYGETRPFRRVAVVLDVEATAPELPSQTLLELLSRKQTRLTFLLVFKPGGRHTEKLKRTLDALYSTPELAEIPYSVHVVQQRDITRGVMDFVEEFAIDLVVASQKKRLLDYLRPSTTSFLRQAALTAKVPCLAVA